MGGWVVREHAPVATGSDAGERALGMLLLKKA